MEYAERVTAFAGRQGITYHYAAGRALSYFYQKLRDERRIFGNRCPKCGNVFVPPIDFCRTCFVEVPNSWVAVSDKGELWSYSVILKTFVGYMRKPPWIYAQIKLDGADDYFYHIVLGANLDKVEIGMRVEAVWAEERGRVSDTGDIFGEIAYFRPVEEWRRA